VIEFSKSMEPHFNYDKVINVERLKTITDVPQINLYKDFTNNFSPEGLAKLKPEEVLHLNLCEWLEPKARVINERIKQAGGLKIIEARDGIKCVTEIHEFDLFHSLLGEVKPGSIRNHTNGGHLLIPELKAALLDIGDIEHVGNGFFDIGIKYAGKESINYELKTFFPIGTTVEGSVAMIEDVIKMPKNIRFENINIKGRVPVYITNTLDYEFGVHIEKGIARFYPMKPKK